MPGRQGPDDRDEAAIHEWLVQARDDGLACLGAVLDIEHGLQEIVTCTGAEGAGASWESLE